MQDLLDTCASYADEHDIKFNTNKSVVLVRRNKLMKDATIPKFRLCDNDLSEVDEAKYLGYLINLGPILILTSISNIRSSLSSEICDGSVTDTLEAIKSYTRQLVEETNPYS